jgi:hypothetical protein
LVSLKEDHPLTRAGIDYLVACLSHDASPLARFLRG